MSTKNPDAPPRGKLFAVAHLSHPADTPKPEVVIVTPHGQAGWESWAATKRRIAEIDVRLMPCVILTERES